MKRKKREPKIKNHCVGNDNDSLCTHALHGIAMDVSNSFIPFVVGLFFFFAVSLLLFIIHHLRYTHMPYFHNRYVYFDIGSSEAIAARNANAIHSNSFKIKINTSKSNV